MIIIKNLYKTYNLHKNNAFTALKNISFTISDKDFISIVGPSGSGKSTLLHIMSGIESFDDGNLIIDNIEIKKLKEKELSTFRCNNIGIVLQDYALLEEYSVFDNVLIPIEFSGKRVAHKSKRVMSALEQVGIEKMAKKRVNQLSGGEKQRVAIARAIVNNPKYIFADEPTGALDSANSTQIFNLLKMLNDCGKTVIIVTHDREISSKCSRTLQIFDGRIDNE